MFITSPNILAINNLVGKFDIEAPKKGDEVTKKQYNNIIFSKMKEFRDNRGRRRG